MAPLARAFLLHSFVEGEGERGRGDARRRRRTTTRRDATRRRRERRRDEIEGLGLFRAHHAKEEKKNTQSHSVLVKLSVVENDLSPLSARLERGGKRL